MQSAESYVPAQVCAASIVACYAVLPGNLTPGPGWILPALAGALLVGLVITSRDRRPDDSLALRRAAFTLVGILTVGNAGALALLVHELVTGGGDSGRTLITAGAAIWLTNVAVFALWFWELDGDGPGTRGPKHRPVPRDWLFPQDATPEIRPDDWRPGFVDYFYLSFTNATAFSPTDTMPLTPRAKLLMLGQSLTSLVTIGLVIARAVNILS